MAYVDRPTPRRAGARANSTLGAVVRNALRALFDTPQHQRTSDAAARLVGRYWRADGFADHEQARVYRERAREWVRRYVERHDLGNAAVAVERWVSAPAGSLLVEGRVDRIDRRRSEQRDQLVVVDYKTGRRAPTDEQARDSLPLGLYAMAVRGSLRQPCSRVELHHLPSETVAAWQHTEESLTHVLRRAERLAGEITEATRTTPEPTSAGAVGGERFPTRTGPHCGWCDFRANCAEGQRAAPATPPWGLLGHGDGTDRTN